ncbi:MAG: hypothetical protein P1U72_04060 [Paracoccaceae bacterium]|nr:hypothetical protein [Paracoccaceae bacterium]
MAFEIQQDVLLTFFSGAISAYLFLKYRMHMTERSSQLSDHIKDIERLSEAAIALWSNSKTDGILERVARVKLHHMLAVSIFPRVAEVCHKDRDGYKTLMLSLFDLTAADDDRFAEPHLEEISVDERNKRVIDIITVSSDLLTLVRETRLEVSTIKYVATDLWIVFSKFCSWVKRDLLTP